MPNKVVEKHDTVSFFREKMQNHKQPLIFKVLDNYNILKNKCDDMVIVILCRRDGKMDHCITVWGKWIFDSNFKNALPLTVESLDLCCSSDESNDTFVQVVQAIICMNYRNYIDKTKKQKNNCMMNVREKTNAFAYFHKTICIYIQGMC